MIPSTVIVSSGQIKNNNLLLKRNYYMQKGLIYLKYLYNDNDNTLKTKEMLQQEYGIDITFFDHLYLIHYIPRYTKNIIAAYIPQVNNSKYEPLVTEICRKPKVYRRTYNNMIKKLKSDRNLKSKWEEILDKYN